MNPLKIILIISGTLSLCLGIIGIFVPGLPTTPFLLLTAAIFARSSDRLYQKLLSNKHLGPYISEFRKNQGMTRRSKFYAISMMWLMISISVAFLIGSNTTKLIVLIVGISGTIIMGFVVPTVKVNYRDKQ